MIHEHDGVYYVDYEDPNDSDTVEFRMEMYRYMINHKENRLRDAIIEKIREDYVSVFERRLYDYDTGIITEKGRAWLEENPCRIYRRDRND